MFTTLHMTAEPTVREVLAIPDVDPHRRHDPDRLAGRTVRAGESPAGRGLRPSQPMGGRQAWRRWLSAASVVRRRSTTTASRPVTACCARRWRRASSSASTERPWPTSPQRADVSAPAIYNHFGGKVELLVAAARWDALSRLGSPETSVGRSGRAGRGSSVPVAGVRRHPPPPRGDSTLPPPSAIPRSPRCSPSGMPNRRSCGGPPSGHGPTTQWSRPSSPCCWASARSSRSPRCRLPRRRWSSAPRARRCSLAASILVLPMRS